MDNPALIAALVALMTAVAGYLQSRSKIKATSVKVTKLDDSHAVCVAGLEALKRLVQECEDDRKSLLAQIANKKAD